jgi:hypothetical protein
LWKLFEVNFSFSFPVISSIYGPLFCPLFKWNSDISVDALKIPSFSSKSRTTSCLNSVLNFEALVQMLGPRVMLCVCDKMATTLGRRSVLRLLRCHQLREG